MKNLFSALFQNKENWAFLFEKFSHVKEQILVTGLLEQQRIHMAHIMRHRCNQKILYLVSHEAEGKRAFETFSKYRDKVIFISMEEIHFYSIQAKDKQEESHLINNLFSLVKGEFDICIVTVTSLMRKFIPKSLLEENHFSISLDTIIALDKLSTLLITMGYSKEHKVEGLGQFSIRGGIVDIFSPGQSLPIRIEFFDEEVDSIRSFDPYTQKSIEKLDRAEILPSSVFLYEPGDFIMPGRFSVPNNINEDIIQDLVHIQNKTFFPDMHKYVDLLYPEKNTSLFSYFEDTLLVFINDPDRMFDIASNTLHEFSEGFAHALQKGFALKSFGNLLWHPDYLKQSLEHKFIILQSYLPLSMNTFTPSHSICFDTKEPTLYQGNLNFFFAEIRLLISMNYKVIITSPDDSSLNHMYQSIKNEGISITRGVLGDFEEEYSVFLVKSDIDKGYLYVNDKIAVFTPSEIFKAFKKRDVKKLKSYKGKKIDNFIELKVGDYVVHESYGIGRFIAVEQREFDKIKKDYIKIVYNGGDALYVPLEQMEKVQKYIGNFGGDTGVRLSKLGTNEWRKSKSKVKKAVEAIAKELVELYAKREQVTGFAFSKDTIWQKEFEDSFAFDETQDQLKAIEDTKNDMEDPKVMDRLICGDVGYGKTEVAIRAIFKAIMDSKQCAFLVPTTILAQQHYRTLTERFKDYPIRVEVISRFRKKSEIDLVLRDLQRGLVDIIIGTHRILSQDVHFSKLGLLVIDEEQRFGVKDKEKVKQLKTNVDVLTLSATPIPRTLHLSLSGIRDMSLLEEPPHDRLPIMTYVTEAKEGIIVDAIEREVQRGGQVLFVYNRVESIEKMYERLKYLLPNMRIAIGHGQMSPRKLETLMLDFLNKDYDILLSTTIIETGIDISNANTIIVYNADFMGLSQLYQLRGRVGRSSMQGFAYLMYQRDKVLSEISEKRLRTIKEFTEFGSGFKIAMRDLEIRGAGNILGERQHGHMGEIGYELYVDMLSKEIKKIIGEETTEDFETEITIQLNAYIPDIYIINEQDKIEMYKKIATIRSKNDLFDLEEEMEDRFSTIPHPVLLLLQTAYIRSLGQHLKVSKISEKNRKVQFYGSNSNLITEQHFPEKDDYIFLKKIAAFLEKMI